jgi:drug/metabolite transporter (DMT)-like permease
MNQFVLLALLVALLSASQVVIMKHVTTVHSSEASFAMFSLMYFFLTLLFLGRNKDKVTSDVRTMAAPIILMILFAVLLSFLSNYIYYKLIKTNNVTVTSALISTAPLFIAIYSYFILRESLSAKNLAGVGLIVSGVMLLA